MRSGGTIPQSRQSIIAISVKPLRTVRGQTPAASAMASGVRPLSTCRTIRSRPRGVSWAFLCTFIRSS
jgi:hypothetical protein